MSREVFIKVRDDLDGSDADETLTFTYRSTHYEIDLSQSNVELFDKSMDQFIQAARRVTLTESGPAKRGEKDKDRDRSVTQQRKGIRAWATDRGFPVAPRGILPSSIIEAYQAANPHVIILSGVLSSSAAAASRVAAPAVPVTAQQADEDGLISAASLLSDYAQQTRAATGPDGAPLSKYERMTIRRWAKENGLEQSGTGQIKKAVLEAYFAANPKG